MMPPEYERHFYIASIASMCVRYEAMFKKARMGWRPYYKATIKQIGRNVYTIWVFLCGLEPVIVDCLGIEDMEQRKKHLLKSTKRRIWALLSEERMMKDYLENI
jgi:hypothetical protein